MPALPNVPGTLRVDLKFDVGTDGAAKCRYFLRYTGTPPTSSQLNSSAAGAEADFNTYLKPLMGVANSLVSVTVTDLTSPTAGVGTNVTSVVGTRTGSELPGNICALVSLTVARRYRGGHPRIYFPFGTATDLATEQTWTSGFVTEVESGVTNYFNDNPSSMAWAGGTITGLGNVSYYDGFTPFTGPTGRVRNISKVRTVPIVDQVEGFVARQGIASQRKRLLRLA